MGTLVFIYGTLKTGQCRSSVLRKQLFHGEAVAEPGQCKLYDIGPYPAIARSPDGVAVRGELWEVDDECLATLDMIEGSPYLYRREPIRLSSHSGKDVQSYFYQEDLSSYPECGTCWPREKNVS